MLNESSVFINTDCNHKSTEPKTGLCGAELTNQMFQHFPVFAHLFCSIKLYKPVVKDATLL